MADPATTRFHYEPVFEYTGLVQFCIDRQSVAEIKSGGKVFGTVRRGEVVRMKEGLAGKLVTRGGNFTHVAADTPIGQPEEYKHLTKTPAAPVEPIEPEEMLGTATPDVEKG